VGPTDHTERASPPGGGERPEPGGRLRVLHVTEAFAAGTGLAIISFARATQDQGVDSFLAAQDRGSGLVDELAADSPFVEARILPPGLPALGRGVREAVDAFHPDLVHVHSSLAGAVVRLLPMRVPVVYSPHCFAFERRDVSPVQRGVFRAAEQLLARRTAAFVCVSPREAGMAQRLGGGALVRYLINSSLPVDPAGERRPAGEPADALRLVGVGRLTPQKDPAFFADVVTALRETGVPVEGTWIGAGDDGEALAALQRANVRLTGWVPSPRVPALLAEQSFYVHTAAWEGGPIAVLDAMAAGLTVVVRRIDAYEGLLPGHWLFDDLSEAVEMIRTLSHPPAREARLQEQRVTLERFEERGPAAVLGEVYRETARTRSA
jgi:glycosyltransferase involved in cell wall biosynthesis